MTLWCRVISLPFLALADSPLPAPVAAGPRVVMPTTRHGPAAGGEIVEPVSDLPTTPSALLDFITLFPDPGSLSPGTRFNDQRFGFVLHGSVRAGYETNIFIQRVNAEEDFIFTISPGVALGWGDFKSELAGSASFARRFERPRSKSFVYADYTPSWSKFVDHAEEDTFDHDARIEGEWSLPAGRLGVRAHFQTLNAPDEDVGGRARQTRFSGALTGSHDLGGRASLEANAYVEGRDYESYVDHWEVRNEDWLNCQLQPQVNLGFGVALGRVERSEGPAQTFEQALLRLRYVATGKLTFGLTAGPEFRQTEDDGDRCDGVFALDLAWVPFDGAYLYLQGYRRTEPSGTADQDYAATGVQVQFRERLFAHCYFGLAAGYRHSDYHSLTSLSNSSRADDLYFVRPSLAFDLTQWLNCELLGEYRSNDSTSASRSFEATTAAVQFNVLF